MCFVCFQTIFFIIINIVIIIVLKIHTAIDSIEAGSFIGSQGNNKLPREAKSPGGGGYLTHIWV